VLDTDVGELEYGEGALAACAEREEDGEDFGCEGDLRGVVIAYDSEGAEETKQIVSNAGSRGAEEAQANLVDSHPEVQQTHDHHSDRH
jgi:hypothetical protein